MPGSARGGGRSLTVAGIDRSRNRGCSRNREATIHGDTETRFDPDTDPFRGRLHTRLAGDLVSVCRRPSGVPYIVNASLYLKRDKLQLPVAFHLQGGGGA